MRLYSKDTNVPRSRFVECGSGKCSGILGAGTQVKLTILELERVAEANGWVDVCKETEN